MNASDLPRRASGRRLPWRSFAAAATAVVVAQWTATQWIAHRLSYHAALGDPWLQLGALRVYAPTDFWVWYLRWRTSAGVLHEGFLPLLAGALLAVGLALGVRLREAADRGAPAPRTTARWAHRREVANMGLRNTSGVVLGSLGTRTLIHNGPEHVFVSAPPRSGKAASVIVPTLLTWPGSVVVTDIAGEHYQRTAGWRARGTDVFAFNPTSADSSRFNPLAEVRPGDHELRDVQNIVEALVDPDGVHDQRIHGEKTSHSLLVATMLHVLYAEQDKTLSGVTRFLADPDRDFVQTLEAMQTTPHLEDGPHPVVASTARMILNASASERDGALSTARCTLGLFCDPIVARNTSASDFRIADLMCAARPMSLYLVVPPSDLERTRTLVRLILSQICRRVTEVRNAEPAPEPRLLLVLDELASLGRLDAVETSLVPEYGIKALILANSPRQLEQYYGRDNPIVDSCHVRAFFAPRDQATTELISELCGNRSVRRWVLHFHGRREGAWLPEFSVWPEEISRPLLTPEKARALHCETALVIVAGHSPLRARAINYKSDRVFAARLLPTPKLGVRPTRPSAWAGRVIRAPIDARPVAASDEPASASPRQLQTKGKTGFLP